MGWNNGRVKVVWVVQRKSTKKVLAVYDRLFLAKRHVEDDPTTQWTRMDVNYVVM